jgi:hypothetical protein
MKTNWRHKQQVKKSKKKRAKQKSIQINKTQTEYSYSSKDATSQGHTQISIIHDYASIVATF